MNNTVFKMLLSCIVLFSFLTTSQLLLAQISSGGTPKSFNNSSISSNIQTISMPVVNVDSFIKTDTSLIGVHRYGIVIPIDIGITNAGTWDILEDSSLLWRLEIFSNKAFGLELTYDNFFLPEGATLFLYSEDKNDIIGAFTSKNNKEYRKFSTGPIKGDKIILEYNEPANVNPKADININSVIHIFDQSFVALPGVKLPGFRKSASCNVNAICKVDWCNQRRSVARMSGGGLSCSGKVKFGSNNKVDFSGSCSFKCCDSAFAESLIAIYGNFKYEVSDEALIFTGKNGEVVSHVKI